jgi:hypothetical protein
MYPIIVPIKNIFIIILIYAVKSAEGGISKPIYQRDKD